MPAFVSKGNLVRRREDVVLWVLGNVRDFACGRRRKLGQEDSVGTPSSAKIFEIWSTSVLPWRMGSLDRSSPKIHPMLHMSTSGPYSFAPSRSSGDRYHSVTTSCVSGGLGSPVNRARPKSATLICPRLFMSRLDVLRSRCTIQWLCISAVAETSCNRRVLISDCKKGSCMLSESVLRSCSIKSMTRYTLSPTPGGFMVSLVPHGEKRGGGVGN